MRRPLCLFGMAFVAALLLKIFLLPRETDSYVALDREPVVVAGVVEGRERKLSREKEVTVLSLGQVLVLKPEQVERLASILKQSEQSSPGSVRGKNAKQIRSYCKNERQSLCLPAAKGVQGMLVYVEGREPPLGSFALFEGKFYAFPRATNPGQFDSAAYYQILGQQGRLMKASLLATDGTENVFRETLSQIRSFLSLLLRACCPEREAGILGAMLLGEKGLLDEEIKGLYQQNGIVHILAISGLHLSLLGMGFYKLLRRIRMPIAVDITLTIALMYAYGVMTGMGVSILRAFVMFGLKLFAELIRRSYDLLTAMTVAALLILVQQPLYLSHSGFLFSFGAVCGIGFLPVASVHVSSWKKPAKALFSGLWVSLATLPVHLFFYYAFPPWSVLLNLLVIPCMGIVLLSGVAVLAAGMFALPLGKLAAFPGILVLALYEKCCQIGMILPGRQWITGRPALWQALFFPAALIGLALLGKRLRRWQFFLGIAVAAFVLTFRPPEGVELSFLDVGQGDCIYLQGGGKRILIDGGSSDVSDVGKYRIAPFLKYRGAGRLDAVFVTHPDSDHENGIRGLLEAYEENGIRIGALVLPDVSPESRNDNYRTLEALAAKKGVPVQYIAAGDSLRLGKVMLTCLHPERGYENQDTNAYSTTLFLQYGAFSALFTGDLEGEGEELVEKRLALKNALFQAGADRLTLLKVAHHGSKNSTDEAFLELLRPRLALISAGAGNSYGHPHQETLKRLAAAGSSVCQTKDRGAVTLRIRRGRVSVEAFCGEAIIK